MGNEETWKKGARWAAWGEEGLGAETEKKEGEERTTHLQKVLRLSAIT